MTENQHIHRILQLLNEQADYAVMRNYEGLPEKNNSRDIDIIIPKKTYQTLLPQLKQALRANDWKILLHYTSDRLQSFVCGKAGEPFVQWDFFWDTSIYGITLMRAEEFLQHKRFNGVLWYLPNAAAYMDKYLYFKALGKSVPEHYAHWETQAQATDWAKRPLHYRHILWSSFWHYLGKHHIGSFVWTYIRNYCKGTGFTIAFSGADGVGKTTVLEEVIHQLSPVFEKAHTLFHFRPSLFPNLGDAAQTLGVKKEVDRNYAQPHRGKPTSKTNSFCRLCYYATDYIVGYWLRVKPCIRITRLAIFDRYYTDIILDPKRTRIHLSQQFLQRFGRLFIPHADYNILLVAPVETIRQRKQELDNQAIHDIQNRMHALAEYDPHYWIVENTTTPNETAQQIITRILMAQDEKL